VLARAAVAVGVAGVFMEIHPDPDKAFSDGPNQWQLHRAEEMLTTLKSIDEVAKSVPYLEESL
jgi:2-dehydro-3-deoxyphosphooctonate aldolase (KDO 8-P synthase)